MKRMIPATRNVEKAFTLIELLTVIAIIGVLAAMLLSALSRAKINAQKKMATTDEVNLVASINQYYAQYNRLPVSSNAVTAANAATGNMGDFTFGTFGTAGIPSVQTAGSSYQNNNSEVIAILRDDNFPPEASNNVQHIYNPQKSQLFTAKVALDTNSPGVGPDDVFRDPWGSPYIVTLDLNDDQKCYDATLDGMYQQETPKPTGPLLVPNEAVVWSFGPLKTINLGQPLNSAYTNKQTIVTSF